MEVISLRVGRNPAGGGGGLWDTVCTKHAPGGGPASGALGTFWLSSIESLQIAVF